MTSARCRGQRRNSLYGLISAVVLALLTHHLAAQTLSVVDPAHEHPAPGTKLTRFEKIDDGVYKGSEPKNDADYRFLQSKHIKYIVAMKFLPLLDRLEVHRARKYGIVVIPITMNASTFPPSDKHIRQILCLLSDKRLRPVYFHCTIGRDRTALIATLYEIYFLRMPADRARDEMKRFGFKESWTLSGLSDYLEKHANSPWDDSKHTCKRFPLPSVDK
jgi:protein-tyrosine phosphatase